MITADFTDVETSAVHVPIEEHGSARQLTGIGRRAMMTAALAFSSFQLVVAAYSPLSSTATRSLHVAFLLLLTYLLYPGNRRTRQDAIPWYDVALALAAFALGFYHWFFEAALIQRAGQPSVADLVVGTVVVILVFEAARRVLGAALPIISAVFLAYGLFGEYLPGALAHRPFGYDQVVAQLFLTTEGIYGIPTLVSATYIFLFILFGSFLEHSGMMRLFNTVALGTVGHAKGGPAKVAVISSGLMGMISGSGVANVLTVGSFTIPLMKRFGYSAVFAGAVEATASMGGQIMPPVMGAVAFIMAETLDIPYLEICKAAIVPALLYYTTAFWMVHLEAGRAGLSGIPREQCPNAWRALREQWYLVLPLVGLVFMLFDGFTPMFAGMTGLALTALLILGASVSASIGPQAFRAFFWIALGLGASTVTWWGATPVIVGDRRARRAQLFRERRHGDVGGDAVEPDRRRKAGVAGRTGMRDRGRGDRCADPHGRRHQFRGLHPPGWQHQLVSFAAPDNGGLPRAWDWHPYHPELHHHRLDRRSGTPPTRRASHRVAHVRLLFRDHGRPDTARGTRRPCRFVDRESVRPEDRMEGDADCNCRLCRPVHGGLRPGPDAARFVARLRSM